MNKIAFGTDGWRARLAEDFTYPNVRRVAWALGRLVLQRQPKATVYVGFDRRFLSRDFAREAAGILAGMGVATRLSDDVLPTPAYSYLSKKHKAWALIVTASHNPPQDNGLKIKTPDGASAPQQITRDVERFTKEAPLVYKKSRCLPDTSLRREYIAYLKGLARPVLSKLRGNKVAVDYLHGSGAGLLEEVLGNKHVISLRKDEDPYFGGIAPEPIGKNLIALQKLTKDRGAILGVALDGDADRISLVDEKGNYLAPTTVFAMYAYYQAIALGLKGEIVQGVSLGYLGKRIAEKANLPFTWVPVGFKNIAERMNTSDVLIGGEESGGYALGRLLPDRDGVANTLLMLEVLLNLKIKPSALVNKIYKEFGYSFYERYDLRLDSVVDKDRFTQRCTDELLHRLAGNGFTFKEHLLIDGAKLFLYDGSWLLLRPSGTEALVRIYAETPSKSATHKLVSLATAWGKTVGRDEPRAGAAGHQAHRTPGNGHHNS